MSNNICQLIFFKNQLIPLRPHFYSIILKYLQCFLSENVHQASCHWNLSESEVIEAPVKRQGNALVNGLTTDTPGFEPVKLKSLAYIHPCPQTIKFHPKLPLHTAKGNLTQRVNKLQTNLRLYACSRQLNLSQSLQQSFSQQRDRVYTRQMPHTTGPHKANVWLQQIGLFLCCHFLSSDWKYNLQVC